MATMTNAERRIAAAQGYLELGLIEEARRELKPLTDLLARRADVIELHLLCLMAEQRWQEALTFAENLIRAEPHEPGGYIHAAYCLHELGSTSIALELLIKGPKSLRTKSVFYYNVGCYNARLGQINDALKFLQRSFEMDGSLRHAARKDPDLAHLHSQLL